MPFFDLFPHLTQGLWVTLKVYVVSSLAVLVLSTLAGLGRVAPNALLRGLAALYVHVFRGLPVLILLFWLYYVRPYFGIELGAFAVGVLGLGLNYSSYGAEIVRGAITSIPRGQWEAATALNMSRWSRMRYVILPQALVRMLPPYGNLQIELLKNTALVMFISVEELAHHGRVLQNSTQRTAEIFGISLAFYFAIAALTAFVVRRIEVAASRGIRAGGAHVA
ncbi:MAG: ectoine/hydroxyectoine ABC transporter permease subunit EhuC [Planctomycetes bacterium]|nr:ectoine/hydroxyectoine ABC transporter permease subunit EhuC [Planctomycetota bacterium]